MVAQQQILSLGEVHRSLVALFDSNMRAKRVESLASATLQVVRTGSWPIRTIGEGLAVGPAGLRCQGYSI